MPNPTPNDARQWDESVGYDQLNQMLLRKLKEEMPDANKFLKENIGPIAGGAIGTIGGPAGVVYGASLGKFLQNSAEGKGMPEQLGGPIGGGTGPNGLLEGVPSVAAGTALGEGAIAALPYVLGGVAKLTPEVMASLSKTLGNERGSIRLGSPLAESLPETLAAPAEVPARLQRAADMGFDTNKTWFHGTQRPDRVIEAGGFSQKRATSGPMAFFTDDPSMASSYSTAKRDTSLSYEDSDFGNWFKFKVPGERKPVTLDQAWYYLSPEQRESFIHEINKVGLDDQNNIIKGGVDEGISPSTFNYELKRNRGNGFTAAKELWLNSGSIYNQEEEFLDVLRKAGIKTDNIKFDSPHAAKSGVFPVHLKMQNPIDVQDPEVIKAILPELEKAARRQRSTSQLGGADMWDKVNRDPIQWVEGLKEDVEAGKNSHAWTSIPDWVTRKLKDLGFDGILDRGGKMGGQEHSVAVPFAGNQVRSVFATFDPAKANSRNLLASVLGGLTLSEELQDQLSGNRQ